MTTPPDTRTDTPAAALGGAWKLLDVLPRTTSTPSMTSTTLEMVAAAAAGPAPTQRNIRWPSLWQSIMHWALPAAAVIGGLVLGFILGRATLPPPERRPGSNLLERIEQLEQQQREQRERPEPWKRRPPFSPPPGRPNGRPAPRETPAPPR
ncbi:MAG: hypothetical protein WCJ18_05090 [Planctomycetota bacterium]